MRKIFGRFLTRSNPQQNNQPYNPEPCHNHAAATSNQTTLYAHEYCHSCHTHNCYVCSERHLQKNCQVLLSVQPCSQIKRDTPNSKLEEPSVKFMRPVLPKYQNSTLNKILASFNQGEMTKLTNYKNIRCICGKPLSKNFAMCAACGMVSCSSQCHQKWEADGHCTFSKNFAQQPSESTNLSNNKAFSLRSILFSNIQNISHRAPRGTRLTKTSNRFISAYVADTAYTVLLQRGYRNYGSPQESVLENMTSLGKTLDYYLHLDRVCQCFCPSCTSRGAHPTGNCVSTCTSKKAGTLEELQGDERLTDICTCKCELCTSGIIYPQHQKKHCIIQCHESPLPGQNQ